MDNILVIGDVMMDNYLVGNVERISPEAPIPVVAIEDEKYVLGGAGNVVNNLLAFGANVTLMSVVGDSDNNAKLFSLFKDQGINTAYIITEKSRLVTEKTRILSANQQIVRYDKETTKAITKASSDALLKILKKDIKKYKILILSDYGKGIFTDALTREIISLAHKKNCKVLVDPKGDNYSKYTGAYLLTPNKKEASRATGVNLDTNLLEGIQKLKTNYKLDVSIITLSYDGIAVFDNELIVFPTKTKEVYDVTGAGDTVIAAIGYKLSQNSTIKEAVKFANLAAGYVIGKTGAATVTLDEIYANKLEISSLEQLMNIVTKAKQQRKKIVFTNGCFDVLHLGHITYLEKAKALGDILIVGVNSDSSVKRIKGDKRPINPEFDRAYLLKSLKFVDYVIVFNEDTPYNLIKTIKPHILVKGADYKDKEIVGSDIVDNVELVAMVPEKSTTKIINRIRIANDS